MLTQIENTIWSLQTDSHWLVSHYLGPWQHSVWQEELFSPASPLGVIWAARQQLPARLGYIWCSPSLYRDTFYQCFTTEWELHIEWDVLLVDIFNCWLKCEVCQCASVRGSARPDLADRQLYHCYNWRKYRDINYNGNGQSCYRENKVSLVV